MALYNLRNRHFFLSDLLLLSLASYVSFVLRLERFALGDYWSSFAIFTLTAALLTPALFRLTGLYSLYWRYASVDELILLTLATASSVLLTGLTAWSVLYFLPDQRALPRSIPFIFLLLALTGVAAPRLAVRIMHQRRHRLRGRRPQQLTAIMGAGDAGTMIVRELQRNPQLGLEVVGFIDDDPDKQAMRIRSIPVLGTRADITALAHKHKFTQIIIAIPTAPGREIREIVSICEDAGVETKIIPGIYELLDGTVSINQIRDVDIEDLLRREPIQTNIAAVQELIRGKRVLLTGGGGSIGSELCRQIYRCNPSELVLLGHGENSIFEIYQELKAGANPNITLSAVIADIRFPERMHSIFAMYQPQIVFHAAAHKHVPLMEANPAEAITNNILGTRHLVEAARAVGVERFVMVSTDKAVKPTSVMGASKRVAELLVHQAARESGLPFVTVRFGNVLGSRGSVVLTFKKQIARGGPITVTHPEMRRFFMTIPEAVQLVLQAAVLGQGGEVFLLDMGEPIKIADLARDLVELSGLTVGEDIEIVYSGVRPGEKLFEELFIPGETYQRTEHDKIFIAENAGTFVPNGLNKAIDELAAAGHEDNHGAIIAGLKELVPEYCRSERQSVNGEIVSLKTEAQINGEFAIDHS